MSFRISDERVRALIEGPFTAVYTTIANAVLLEQAAQEAGTFVVRYQFNYVCISAGGDSDGLRAWLTEELARVKDIHSELVVAGAENVVEALIACYGHLKKREPGRAQQISSPGSAPAPEAQEGSYPEL